MRLYLQLALALKPNSDVVLLQLAAVAEQQEDSRRGDRPLSRASRRIRRSSALAELQLGLNLADLDRHDEAIAQLKKLLDADPDDMRAYLALGGVYASKEDFRSAADIYDKAAAQAEEADRADWNIFYQRGIAYERLKEWPKAEPNFRKALELFPNQPQVMNYLGYSWVDMNMNLEEGLDLIRKAVDLQPERRLHRRFARLGLLPARPVRRGGARTRARRVAEAGRSGAERPSRRRLLARRPQARSDLPVERMRAT